MTIAIGMIVREGIVLASDTQETAGWFKRDVNKTDLQTVWGLQIGNQTSGISGAGYGPFLDCVVPEIQEQLEKDIGSHAAVPSIVEKCLSPLYSDHIDRPGLSDDKKADLEVAMLIGVGHSRKLSLYVTNRTKVRQVKDYDAVGIGSTAALALMDLLYDRSSPLDAAAITAAYVVWKVKSTVDGCGNYTDLSLVVPDMVVEIERSYPQRWEMVFRNCDALSAAACRAAFDYRAGLHERQMPDFPGAIQTLRDRFQREAATFSVKVAELIGANWKIEAPPGRSL